MRFDVWTSTACAALFAACALFLPAPSRAAEFSNDQKAEIGKIVKEYLLANPDVVKDAIEELDKREKVAEASARETTLTKQADKLFNSPNQAVVGNPDGDVTLVEFFDYNCGYCKQSLTNVAKLIDSDPKLRVVLKDFAILGPDSVEAAEVATALHHQFKGGQGTRRRRGPARKGFEEPVDSRRPDGSRQAGGRSAFQRDALVDSRQGGVRRRPSLRGNEDEDRQHPQMRQIHLLIRAT